MIGISGTPGTGKSSVSLELRQKGYDVLDLKEFIDNNSLKGKYDEERDTYEVDVRKLRKKLSKEEHNFVEGHLSHLLNLELCIVLRCNPKTLSKRLTDRGYNENKVKENVEAELLDVILCEAIDSNENVFVVDTTTITPNETAEEILKIIDGDVEGHMPEDISWSEELDSWY